MLPELRIQLQKVNVTYNITTSVGVPIALQCIAFSARSAGTFTWENGDGHVPSVISEVTMSSNRFYAGTYDVVSKFIFTPLRSTVLSCSHHTDDGEVAIVLLDVSVDSKYCISHKLQSINKDAEYYLRMKCYFMKEMFVKNLDMVLFCVTGTNPQNHTVNFTTITVLLLLVVIVFAITMLMGRITGKLFYNSNTPLKAAIPVLTKHGFEINIRALRASMFIQIM